MHGGSSPQAKRSAKERLLALREPALVALGRVLRDPKVDDSTKVRAALGILDRTGFPAGLKLGVDESVAPWQQLLRRIAGEGADSELEAGGISRTALEEADTAELRRIIREQAATIERLRAGQEIPGALVEDDEETPPPPSTKDRPVRTPRKAPPPKPTPEASHDPNKPPAGPPRPPKARKPPRLRSQPDRGYSLQPDGS